MKLSFKLKLSIIFGALQSYYYVVFFYASTANEITILPTYNDEQEINLMGKTIGPIRANMPITVPYWLAIFLKEQQKCKIQIPDIFKIDQLKNMVERQNDRSNEDPIYLHHSNFFELAYSLLNRAPDTFQKPRQVRSLIESLQTIRFEKMRKIIQKTTGARRLKYFTSYEINKWRGGLSNLQKMVDNLTYEQKKK